MGIKAKVPATAARITAHLATSAVERFRSVEFIGDKYMYLILAFWVILKTPNHLRIMPKPGAAGQ
jgi:hypothetical protein